MARAHVTWYTAMSMDGRIAGAGDDMSFLDFIGPSPATEDAPDGAAEWDAFVASLDGVIIGGSTLRWLVAQGHGWPHGDLPTWVMSSDAYLESAVGVTAEPLRRREGPIAPVMAEIDEAGLGRIWLCGGGDVAGQLLALDRIDEVIVTIAPTALGAGPSLFDGADLPPRRFRVEELRPYGTAAVRIAWTRDPPHGEQ